MKKLIALLVTLGLTVLPFALYPSAAVPTALKTEDFENLQEDLSGSIFYNVLFSKADAADSTADRVINGDKSLTVDNASGFKQFAISHEGLFTFGDNKVYMLNFLLKFHETLPDATQFLFYADTGDSGEAVPAVYFQKADGVFKHTATTNTTGAETGQAVDMGDGLYSVTLRYKTIASPTVPGAWNMRFAVNGAVSLSMDDLSVWEVSADTAPDGYHPQVPEGASSSGSSSSEASGAASASSAEPASSATPVTSQDAISSAADTDQVKTGDSPFALFLVFGLAVCGAASLVLIRRPKTDR